MMSYQQLQKPMPGGASPPNPYPQTNPTYPQQTHRRRDCFCCLLSTFLKIAAGFFVGLFVLILVLWLVLRPERMKVHVESASLTSFNLTSPGNSLRHNLSLEFSVRNPNKRAGVYYDWLDTSGYYDGKYPFQWTGRYGFYMGHKSTTVVGAVLAGTTPVGLDQSGLELFRRQSRAGTFDVEVRLQAWVRYRVGSITTRSVRLRYRCWLPGLRLGAKTGFVRTRCKLD